MKTVILVSKAGSKAFSDDEIRAAVTRAGSSTLILDQRSDDLFADPSAPCVDRVPFEAVLQLSDRKKAAGIRHSLELDPSKIWVMSMRGLRRRQVGRALRFLRSRIFDLATPPPAIVLETDTADHVELFKQLRNEFFPTAKRRKYLEGAERQTKWLALALRVFGRKGYKLAKKLAQVTKRRNKR